MMLSHANFHLLSFLFYAGYAFLCVFAYRPYCRHIYMTPVWTDHHDVDPVLEYMTIGAGQCCLVMAVLTYYCRRCKDPAYWTWQTAIWVMFTVNEAYYTWVRHVEPNTTGTVHVVLCSAVLYCAVDGMLKYRAVPAN